MKEEMDQIRNLPLDVTEVTQRIIRLAVRVVTCVTNHSLSWCKAHAVTHITRYQRTSQTKAHSLKMRSKRLNEKQERSEL
jgi:hypothetical protein